jgi:hypothetical protein
VITLGPKSFSGWPAARKYLVDLTRSQSVGTTIEGEALEVIEAALPYHSEFELKVGPGVYRFTVKHHPEFPNTKSVVVERVDQTSVPVSFKNLGKDLPAVKRVDRLQALRRAIKGQILEFRDQAFHFGLPLLCPVAGVPLSRHNCHVDHVAPVTFSSLVEGWLDLECVVLDELELVPPPHPICELAHAETLASWKAYHALHCKLRLLSPEGHKRVTAENHKGGA